MLLADQHGVSAVLFNAGRTAPAAAAVLQTSLTSGAFVHCNPGEVVVFLQAAAKDLVVQHHLLGLGNGKANVGIGTQKCGSDAGCTHLLEDLSIGTFAGVVGIQRSKGPHGEQRLR